MFIPPSAATRQVSPTPPSASTREVTSIRSRAEQGFAIAQYNLGIMYGNGDGVPQDDAEAVRWYFLAAEQGNEYAQSLFLSMYHMGGRCGTWVEPGFFWGQKTTTYDPCPPPRQLAPSTSPFLPHPTVVLPSNVGSCYLEVLNPSFYGLAPMAAIPARTTCASSAPLAPLALIAPTTCPPRRIKYPPSPVTPLGIESVWPAANARA